MSLMAQEVFLDVEMQKKGDVYQVMPGPILQRTGWRGGQWVHYVTPSNLANDFEVEASNGNMGTGFILFSSEEYSQEWGAYENWSSRQPRLTPGVASGSSMITIVSGGGRYLLRVYETIALVGAGTRTGGPITYTLNDILRVSENGLLCNDSVANLNAAGIANPIQAGVCCMIPLVTNRNRLGVDLKY
jgi:hypothetical protein